MLCSNKKYAHFQVRGSFGKVILAHKGITKTPAYSRIQAFFNVFRGNSTKPKPNLLYDGRPNGSLIFNEPLILILLLLRQPLPLLLPLLQVCGMQPYQQEFSAVRHGTQSRAALRILRCSVCSVQGFLP